MIVLDGLTKRYRGRLAVDELTVTIRPGRVTGFLGPNGSGKTTTMRCVLGLTRPTAGTATVLGSPYRELDRPLCRVGALVDPRARHPGRTAVEHLRGLAESNALPRRRVGEVIELVGLAEVAHERVRGFSLGMGQRLGIAAALLGDPEVLLLDEPVNGLDPEGIRWIRELLRGLAAEGRTVLVSSHLMSEMAETADHFVVLGRGRLLADVPVDRLLGAHAAVRVRTPRPGLLADAVRGGRRPGRAGGRRGAAGRGDRGHRRGGSRLRRGRPGARAGAGDRLAGGRLPRVDRGRRRVPRGRGVTVQFPALLRSEWTKLRSLRATWWCAGVYLITVGAFGWLAAATTSRSPSAELAVSVALTGFGFGQLAVVVLAVLTVSSEFTTGSALASFVAVPRRTRLLVAKTLVVVAFCALLTAVLAVVCALAARTLTVVPGGVSLTDPAVLRALGAQVAAAVLLAMLSVALGALLRSTAGGVGLGTALVFVLPVAVPLMGGATAARVSQALPAVRVGEDPFLAVGTSWPVGLAVAAAWAVACWALAAVLLERRDV